MRKHRDGYRGSGAGIRAGKGWRAVAQLSAWHVVFSLIIIVFSVAGYWYYRDEAQNLRREHYNALAAIGRLKALQIQDWRSERLAGARRSAGSPFFRRVLGEYRRDHGSTDLRDVILEWLRIEQEHSRYADVLVLAPDGEILISVGAEPDQPHPVTLRAAAEAAAGRTAVLSDLYRCEHGLIHIDTVVPVFDAGEDTPSVLVFRGNAEDVLFPLLELWPVLIRSAETLLVGREGDEVVILNEPRHRPGAALALRSPLANGGEFAAVQATLGMRGMFQGRDYRGVPVLADLEAIPGSPWFLITQMDLGEMQRLLRIRAGMIALFVILGILLAAAAFGLLHRQRQAEYFRERLRFEQERRAAAEALQESRQMLRLILDSYPVRIFWKDRDSNYLGCNLSFARDAGLRSPEEIVDRTDFDIGWVAQAEKYRVDDRAVIESGRPMLNFEEPLSLPDGRTILLRTNKIPLRDVDGTIIGVLGTYEDITESKRAEQERVEMEARLRQAQKMEAIGRLAGGVAHDFNNMLGIIIGNAGLALSKLDPEDPLHADIREIMSAGRRSADLVRQLLGFARTQIIAPKILDLNNTVAGMLKMLERLVGENIELNWKPAADLPPVRVDPVQIDQILANLVVNARDAIAGAGRITIETSLADLGAAYCRMHAGFVPGRYVMLTVGDDGCGMDKETRERIFEPFFTTKKHEAGTGLGLATVYGIVKQNNGFIEVASEPERGTTCRIYLPFCEPGTVCAEEVDESDATPTGSETILLVEDEEALLRLYTAQLEQMGYTVLAAGGPREAIGLAEKYSGDINMLISDVVMPEMNGRELWLKLRALRPDLKFLFISGYTADVIAHHGVLDAGVNFLAKPFSAPALAEKISEALGEP